MKKYVNGKLVDMSADEIKARQEEEKEEQALEPSKKLAMLRLERNFLLGQTDWTQNRDVNLSNDSDWKTYRQALRDLPASASPKLDSNGELDFSSITWPTQP